MGSLSQRYCLLLGELRLESMRKRPSTGRAAAALETAVVRDAEKSPSQLLGDHRFTPVQSSNLDESVFLAAGTSLNGLLPDGTPDYAEWDQFASMVTSGLGNLDAFVGEDLFGQFNEYAPS